jgi:protein-export membrane protein SecD
MSDNILQKIFQPGQRGKVRWVFIIIVILTLIASLIDGGQYYNKAVDKIGLPLPHVKEIPFRLGLDLLGGTQLVYQADVSAVPDYMEKSDVVNGARDVIERRVNIFGVSEPNIQVNKISDGNYRVIVELAGVKDINEAIKMIGETPLLEFKEEGAETRELTEEEKNQLNQFNMSTEKRAEEILGKVLSGGDFSALAKEFSEDSATKDNGGDLGWITEKDNQEIFNLAKGIAAGKTSADSQETGQGYEIIKVEEKRVKKDPFTELEDKEVKASHLLICNKNINGCENNLTKEEAYAKIKEIKEQATQQNFFDLVKQYSTEPGAEQNGGELGWFGKGMMVKPFEDAVFEQKTSTISYVVETQFGYHLIYKQDERLAEEYNVKHILVKTKSAQDITGPQSEWKITELTGKNLKRSVVEFNPNDNSPEVGLEFDDEGAKMFEEITSRNVGKQVAIFLDGLPISAPTVNEKISGGKAVITGKFNIKEAKLLVQRLNAGALPVPIHLINQQNVGASLGRDSLIASLKAGIIGFALVALFMIILYRFLGFIAVISLAIYSLLVLAIFKFWAVTLTLSGMAGFIISIGMAVDANILIFARLKEELRKGKPLDSALEESFRRAWPSIRDSNFFTMITCLILITFSTSVVKGFAITLLIGVIISMFSAVFITKNFLKLIPVNWLDNKRWLIGMKNKKLN